MRSNFWLLVRILAIGIWLQGGASPCHAEVSDEYEQAVGLYKSGKGKKAAEVLSGLVKRFPRFEPARLLLGHIFYSNGQIKSAAQQFENVNPASVNDVQAFEIGYVFYEVGQCSRAIPVLRNVRLDGVNSLASFYGAVCLARIGRTDESLALFSQIKGLPSNLERQRQQAMLAMRQRQQSIARYPQQYLPPITIAAPQIDTTKDLSSAGAVVQTKEKNLVLSFTPALRIIMKSTEDDFHGYKLVKSKSQVIGGNSAANVTFNESAGSTISLGIIADREISNSVTSSSVQQQIIYISSSEDAGNPESPTISTTDSKSGGGKSTLTLTPKLSVTPVANTTLALSGSFVQRYQNGSYQGSDTDAVITTRGGDGAVSINLGLFSLGMGGGFSQQVNADQVVEKTEIPLTGSINLGLEKVSASLTGKYLIRQVEEGVSKYSAKSNEGGPSRIVVPVAEKNVVFTMNKSINKFNSSVGGDWTQRDPDPDLAYVKGAILDEYGFSFGLGGDLYQGIAINGKVRKGFLENFAEVGLQTTDPKTNETIAGDIIVAGEKTDASLTLNLSASDWLVLSAEAILVRVDYDIDEKAPLRESFLKTHSQSKLTYPLSATLSYKF